jgi:hypothetical protein
VSDGDLAVIPSEEAMRALVGHRFPGGSYRIEHWENFLLSEATGIDPLPDRLAHPVHLFHVAINGVGTTISELFRLAESGPGAPVSIDYYDWRIREPLREEETYALSGGITDHARTALEGAPTCDSFVYEIDLDTTTGVRVAEVAFRWHYWRVDTPGETS